MALLPPSPVGQPPGNSFWNDWYEKLRTIINTGAVSVAWANITGKPTTLAGFGITDGQQFSQNLAAISTVASNGLYARTGATTAAARTIVAGSSKVTVTNGDGVAGNPTVDIVPGQITTLGTLSSLTMSGPISGVTNLTSTGNTVLGDAAADTVNMGAGGFIKTAANQVGINCTPISAVAFRVENAGNADVGFEWIRTSATVGTLTSYNRNGAAFTTMGFNGLDYSWQTGGGNAMLLSNAGQLALQNVGTGFSIKEGANAKQGASTLVAGTVTVNTTAVTTSSRIHLTPQNSSGTPGSVYVSARVAGTSFTITSTSGTDTRLVAWTMFEPS